MRTYEVEKDPVTGEYVRNKKKKQFTRINHAYENSMKMKR
jgi:hypothetical protein